MQAQGVLERDENILAQSRMDLERYSIAWARNAIAKQVLDDQEKIVLQNEGTVRNDRGAVRFDQIQVEFCHITAPIAGVVGLRLVDPGNVVQANGNLTLAVVTQMEPITVVFTIAQDSLGSVRERFRSGGAPLEVEALERSAQRKIATGFLLALDNQIDTTTGTVKARAQFENSRDELFPNQFVNTRLLVDTHRAVTLVAASAIQQNGTQSFVYVIEGGVAHLRPVQRGVTDRGVAEVQGLRPAEVVADGNFDRLHDGSSIVVTPAPPPSATPGSSGP
jgi:multidrug efflux system membrane fusion protein